MIQPMKMANRTKATKAPMRGQNMRGTLYHREATDRRSRASGLGNDDRSSAHAWSATCSLGLGNDQATFMFRSWRKTKRIWRGGRSPSGRSGRYVAQGPLRLTAQSRLAPKKQLSQLGFVAPVRPFGIPEFLPEVMCVFSNRRHQIAFAPEPQSRFPENA